MVIETAENLGKPTMQQGEGRGGELPRRDVKGQAFGGAEQWEPSPGPRSPLRAPTQPPPAGSPHPRFQAGFQLVTKTEVALYVLHRLCQGK